MLDFFLLYVQNDYYDDVDDDDEIHFFSLIVVSVDVSLFFNVLYVFISILLFIAACAFVILLFFIVGAKSFTNFYSLSFVYEQRPQKVARCRLCRVVVLTALFLFTP
jgi:hypothetical protein